MDLTDEEFQLLDFLLRQYIELVYDPEVENARREYFNARVRAVLKEQAARSPWLKPLFNPDNPPEVVELENLEPGRKQFEKWISDDFMPALIKLFKRAELEWDADLAKEKGKLAAVRKVMAQWADEEIELALPDPKTINYDPYIADVLPSGEGFIGRQSHYNALAKSQRVDMALEALQQVIDGPDLPGGGGRGGRAARRGRRRAGKKGSRSSSSKGSSSKGTGSKGTGSNDTGSKGTRANPIQWGSSTDRIRVPKSRAPKPSQKDPATRPQTSPPQTPPSPPKEPVKQAPPKGAKQGMWIDIHYIEGKNKNVKVASKWIEGKVEPTLKNTVWLPRPASGVSDPKAEAYERKVTGGGHLSPYVFTGTLNANGSPHTVSFDGYNNLPKRPRNLYDAKFRTNPHAASIYDPRRADFHRDKLRRVLNDQEVARKLAEADNVTWIVKDPALGGALRKFMADEGFKHFHVLVEK